MKTKRMKPSRNLHLSWALLLAVAASVQGQNQPPGYHAPGTAAKPPTEAGETPKNVFEGKIPDVLAKGKFLLNARLRYEHADQSNLSPSDAPTFRARVGYETAPLHGFKAMAEFEDIRVIGNKHNYNAGGLTGPGKTVVNDPEVTELNQAWLNYENWKTTARVGRQRITLDNQRFIGSVGWRQNEQTFDALSLRSQALEDFTLTYAYAWNVNRVVSDRHPLGDYASDSHFIHAAYEGCPFGKLAAYSYLLDFANVPGLSAATFGASFAGGHTFDKDTNTKISYRAEYAHQLDYGNQPVNYDAPYYNVELGCEHRRFNAGGGYEVLGADNGVRFSTPLGTVVAFNGWSEVFVVNPANPTGLRDAYLWAGVHLPGDIPLKVMFHKFDSQRGSQDFGMEWDAIATRKFGKHWTGMLKYAYYDGKSAPFAFTAQRFWAQVEFNF